MSIGESESIRMLKEQIARVAVTDANVLITGENGSGKDVVAHELHRLSARNGKRMVSIDMGCIPETLFESELFGHEKGAFYKFGRYGRTVNLNIRCRASVAFLMKITRNEFLSGTV